ncbi:MAG: ABC-F family ATP-binding cassette domain-containing protein [Nocardioidaceae bacterium]
MSFLSPLIAHDVSKAYGDRIVLDGLELVANPGQPVGLVGENGVGKSTLLRLLVGGEERDSGSVSLPPEVGYVAQDLTFEDDATLGDVLSGALEPLHRTVRRLEHLAHRLDDPAVADDYAETLAWATYHGAWDADRRAERAGHRLGLAAIDPTRPVRELSGGERTRLALAALVARQPECVILDEPTNHLDDDAIEFLESFLLDLPGVVLVASHDRVFLDRVCSVIVDLDSSHFGVDGEGGNRFGGGFTGYLEHKVAARRRWEEAFAAQQGELNTLRQAARTTARQVGHASRPPRDNDKYIVHAKAQLTQAAVSRRVRNVERRLDVLERDQVRKPPREISFRKPLSGSTTARGSVVFVRGLRVSGRVEVERLDLSAGQHLLVTGANGSGKSSLLHVLAGHLEADAGTIMVSARKVGLLSQDVSFSDPSRTPQQEYDAATGSPVSLRELGLLHPRELARPIGVLSVGQQRRLALAILVAGGVDLLLLDEPTNHISLTLAGELESALERSTGTVVVASHDRWLRSRWPDQVLQVERPFRSGLPG